MNKLFNLKRTHTCGELRGTNVDEEIILNGWIKDTRDLGQLLFITLKDRYGLTQLSFNIENKDVYEIASKLRAETVIAIKGKVISRGENINKKMATGEIEIDVLEIEVLSESEVPPFVIDGHVGVSESKRLEYRFLDLRREQVRNNLILRHHVTTAVRDYLNSDNFLEIETPILTKSTPEGARDYLVPSRVNKGSFYALPQSPQLFKQILMISGYDKYYQIAKCFRDEDLRYDRQPEFTQIDIEMSFVEPEDLYSVAEGVMKRVFKKALNRDLETPFKRLTYAEAMRRFGSDKPDMRFGLEFEDLTELFVDSSFKVFEKADGKIIRGISVPGSGVFSRKIIDQLTETAKTYQAKGLAWTKYKDGKFSGSIAKFLSETEQAALVEKFNLTDNLLLIVADKESVTNAALNAVRLSVGERLNLIDKNEFNFLWVTDFPMFEYNEEAERFVAIHHPFTAIYPSQLDMLGGDNVADILSLSYDLVLNGVELGGGSMRIHQQDVQSRVFKALGISKEEADEKFGFLLKALKYGTPPHGGIAFGLDRIIMLLSDNAESIRDVIAFPKTAKASCLMTNAPSTVAQEQLDDLALSITKIEKITE